MIVLLSPLSRHAQRAGSRNLRKKFNCCANDAQMQRRNWLRCRPHRAEKQALQPAAPVVYTADSAPR